MSEHTRSWGLLDGVSQNDDPIDSRPAPGPGFWVALPLGLAFGGMLWGIICYATWALVVLL